ncbi:MAG: helix-turn-helix transcriptional regulator [Saprospiraceae bacterium]|nr:helix-turn-helix transcriptional regulator [Saprospiraceae bacterium]
MEQSNQLQGYLFDEILTRFPRRPDAVEALSKLLNLGQDAIYRRMRGDSSLSSDEIALLAKTFNVSLDKFIFKQSDSVVFTFNPFSHKVKSFEDYLKGIETDIEMLIKLPDIKIMDAWTEIPFFYHIYFPELFCFKFYVWGRTIWHFDYLQNRKFTFDTIPVPVVQQAQKILERYRQIPSTQLWSLSIMDNTLTQIEYHINSGSFEHPEDALLLCSKVLELAEHMEKMTVYGKKIAVGGNAERGGANLELYHNEMLSTNNTIFVQSKVGRFVYTTISNPNFLKTSDDQMCNYTDKWFKNIIEKSRPMSQSGESGRRFFFDRLRKRIEVVRKRVALIVEEGNDDGF